MTFQHESYYELAAVKGRQRYADLHWRRIPLQEVPRLGNAGDKSGKEPLFTAPISVLVSPLSHPQQDQRFGV